MMPFNSSFWDTLATRGRQADVGHDTREERIAAFNREVDEMEQEPQRRARMISTTFNFQGKAISRALAGTVQHTQLTPIAIAQLETGVTHRKRVLYARIVTKAMRMNSVMVLVEDQAKPGSELAALAVYGLSDPAVMEENRCLAIMEPHYKIRQDGSPGIRVDNSEELVWDAVYGPEETRGTDGVKKSDSEGEGGNEIVNLVDRLQELFTDDPELGVAKAFQKVTSEGHNATKKQIRALKKTILENLTRGGTDQDDDHNNPEPLPPVLSERRPETHRVFTSARVLHLRAAGKKAFEKNDYEAAVQHFSDAVNQAKNEEPTRQDDCPTENSDSVSLWQLIGNRSSAYFKLGMLDEALKDALVSHRCAPREAVKPIMRCAETMVALGMDEDAKLLLSDSRAVFPDHQREFDIKMSQLEPKQVLEVGSNKPYQTIFDALRDAKENAVVVMDPGVYKERPLVIDKPITLRSSKSVSVADTLSEESSSDSSVRPEIRVEGDFSSIICNAKSSNVPIRLVGLKIVCQDVPRNSYHALDVRTGLVVVRNTILTSSSGPVVVVQDNPLQPMSMFVLPTTSPKPSRLIMHSCKVADGAQGGILVCGKTNLTLRHVHVVGNAACGLELREGASAQVENCNFYSNGRQGIMVWMSAGSLNAKHCWIHSNTQESGALVSQGEACFESCEFYGNGAAGVVAQKAGALYLSKCAVHDNCEGVLIQDTGTASVRQCEVYQNRANGIFVGYDHLGFASIVENNVYGNVSMGILIGNKGKNVHTSNNTERDNKGHLPQTPDFMRQRFNPSKRHQKRVQKNRSTIERAMKERKPTGGIMDVLLHDKVREASVLKITDSMTNNCQYCGKKPPEGVEKSRFPRCARCKDATYCSAQCQRNDWPRHKVGCRNKDVKYPMFIDGDRSVND
ncbi:lysine methyltransferase SMYD2 [Seminavis robusta]|uniref:Lysine methyltransferase SMYD2 n=1 Tax=Seminavis robusta TaxID=568900 RepID=A0A9N8H8Q5_9STRA|nr:lysine methyltransferase SMYD2 [Seminavis robusta]|eukprot:Sro177_g077860.1 lysine methyltransferase SMYD2 (908) ;mRNA; f:74484-77207